MGLFRISKFCNGDERKANRVGVRLALLANKGEYSITASTCLVPCNKLAMMGMQEEEFAFLCYNEERVVVQLVLLDEQSDDGETAMASPVVLSNLGILLHCDKMFGNPIFECWFEPVDCDPTMAELVIMRPIGHKSIWPRIRNDTDSDDLSWILPSSNELVQESKTLSVYSDSCSRICHYEILEIHTVNMRSVPYGITSPTTKIELEGSSLPSSICRLPPLPLQECFYSSKNTHFVTPPHPNLKDLLNILGQPPSLELSEKVVHLIGSNASHRVCQCVEAAAQQLGLNCLHLRGLSAFAYHHGKGVRNGSLIEQLSGLKSAFQFIRSQRMEPCVLHLYDFDSELSSLDDQVRHDQEDRIWAHFMQILEADNRSSDQGVSRVSPILIVITTCSPLKVGPLANKLVFPPIFLKTPNEEFARFLWSADDWQDSFWDNQLLKGRNADEIVELCGKLQELEVANANDKHNILKGFCRELDTRKRKHSSQGTLVSTVHWDDVGGLSHVRREIMDAIELPLKHPHLFLRNQGRSGILLYGPPGTGKTLVAKAVATECGLPFFSVKGPELLGSYVGESEASVRAIFQSAREAAVKNAPNSASILFFDELDSLAPRRGGVGDGGGVMERVASTLFSELDCSMSDGRVFVMGATNRPDLLDPSLLRPGRLDRLVYLGVPADKDERTRILAAQIRKLRLEGDPVEIARKVVSQMPTGLTGADLSAIATGALSKAAERLCFRAEDERYQLELISGQEVDVSEVIGAWNKEKLIPVVLLEDLLAVSSQITPSLSEKELERYDDLRQQFAGLSW